MRFRTAKDSTVQVLKAHAAPANTFVTPNLTIFGSEVTVINQESLLF